MRLRSRRCGRARSSSMQRAANSSTTTRSWRRSTSGTPRRLRARCRPCAGPDADAGARRPSARDRDAAHRRPDAAGDRAPGARNRRAADVADRTANSRPVPSTQTPRRDGGAGAAAICPQTERHARRSRVAQSGCRSLLRHVNCRPRRRAWTTPETSSSSPPRAAPASRAWSRRCSSSTRTSRSRSRTRRRKPRGQDQHGREYHFVDDPRFRRMIARGEFVEWAEVHGHLYGTSRAGHRGADHRRQRRAARDRLAGGAADQAALSERGADLHPAAELGRAAPAPRAARRGRHRGHRDRAWRTRASRWPRPGSSTSL